MDKTSSGKSLLSLRLTKEQSALAEKLAADSNRSQQGFFIWLLEAYGSGLLTEGRYAPGKVDELEGQIRDLVAKTDELKDIYIGVTRKLQELEGQVEGKGSSGSLRKGKGPVAASDRARELYEQEQEHPQGRHSKQARHPRQ